MSNQVLDRIRGLKDVLFSEGLIPTDLDKYQREAGLKLPRKLCDVLTISNGIGGYGGCFRILGFGPKSIIDSLGWNDRDNWKFAWEGRVDGFWCFGETAWGDQYAFANENLDGYSDAPVFFLDALAMTAERQFDSFEQFFEREFMRNCIQPYDELTISARAAIGDLSPDLHFVYEPSVLLGGSELVENVKVLNAAHAMVLNGDIACQLDNLPEGSEIQRIEQYTDQKSRPRVRLLVN